MKDLTSHRFCVCAGAVLLLASQAFAVDLNQVGRELAGAGAHGWIHGSVEGRQLYVFTYRNPSNFFDFVEISLVPQTPDVAKRLAALNRHDEVVLKGSFLDIPSPQPHASITSIDLVKPYTPPPGTEADPYDHQARIPDDLQGKPSAVFLIHAVAGEGKILVAEYEDAVIPIDVHSGDLTKNLYRGDLVRLFFKFQSEPDSPTHLKLDESAAQPVQVLESIRAKNGKPAQIQGSLVLFPKSPEIITNIFAVQEKLQDGLSRQYTLVNFDDPDVFNQILSKLQKAWDKYPGAFVNGRNKLVSTKLQVKATGVFNEVDPSQANAQILLKSVDSIEIIESGKR